MTDVRGIVEIIMLLPGPLQAAPRYGQPHLYTWARSWHRPVKSTGRFQPIAKHMQYIDLKSNSQGSPEEPWSRSGGRGATNTLFWITSSHFWSSRRKLDFEAPGVARGAMEPISRKQSHQQPVLEQRISKMKFHA